MKPCSRTDAAGGRPGASIYFESLAVAGGRGSRRAAQPDSRGSRCLRFCSVVSIEDLTKARDAVNGTVGSEQNFLPLEELIAAHSSELFPGMEILDCHPFRVTRDMDIEILEEEASDLLSVVSQELRRRKFGSVVRLELSSGVPERVRTLLISKLQIGEQDVYECSGLLGTAALFGLSQLPRPELRDAPYTAIVPAQFGNPSELFSTIARGDLMCICPGEAFRRCCAAGARFHRSDVPAIKMTMYRTGRTVAGSQPDQGGGERKAGCGLRRDQARFDEENNTQGRRWNMPEHVFMDRRAQDPCKALLIVRREGMRTARHAISPPETTTRPPRSFTTDVIVLRTRSLAGCNAAFNSLSGFSSATTFKLAAGPHSAAVPPKSKSRRNGRAGKPARIFAKMNSLVDITDNALYAARRAGIDRARHSRHLLSASGLPGVSENIRACSIVDAS